MRPIRPTFRSVASTLLALVAAGGVLAGRAALADPSAPQQLAITATSSGISDGGVTRIDPALTDVSLANTDTGEHALHVLRLDDGTTFAQFETALRSGNPEAVGRIVTWYGGVNSVPTGSTWHMSIVLARGEYVLLDSGQGADGAPNFTHPGFIRALRVDGNPASAAPPVSNVDIRQVDFAFQMPAELPRDAVLHVTNAGAQPHEMDFLLLDAGVTPQQALQALAHHQEPPGKEIDVLTAFSPGLSAWVPVHLEAGTYLVVSLFPDVTKGGLPQAAEGMVGSFVVR